MQLPKECADTNQITVVGTYEKSHSKIAIQSVASSPMIFLEMAAFICLTLLGCAPCCPLDFGDG